MRHVVMFTIYFHFKYLFHSGSIHDLITAAQKDVECKKSYVDVSWH